MQTVPTVAATASIVGFASVGWTLGRRGREGVVQRHSSGGFLDGKSTVDREEQPVVASSSILPVASEHRPPRSVPSPAAVAVAVTSAPRASLEPATAVTPHDMAQVDLHPANMPFRDSSFSPSSSTQSRVSYDGQSTGKVRRLALHVDAPQQRRQDQERTSQPAQPRPRPRTSSRQSWIKRLSVTMSSRSVSPSSDLNNSPRLAQSTDSKSFSQHSSTAPILDPRPATAIPGPNKLVKRSSSRRLGVGTPSDSRPFTLPRPATSHQRSAALQFHAVMNGPTLNETPSIPDSEDEVRWRHFFTVKMKRPRPDKTTRAFSYDPSAIRRILPDRFVPTLVSAKTIVASSFDMDDMSFSDDGSVGVASRPSSSLAWSARLSKSEVPEKVEETRPVVDALPRRVQYDSDRASEDSGLPRPYSLQGLIRRRSTSGRPSLPWKPSKLVKRAAGRVFSEPSRSVGLNIEESPEERPSKRRSNNNAVIGRREADAQRRAQHEAAPTLFDVTGGAPATTLALSSGKSSPLWASLTNSPNLLQQSFLPANPHSISASLAPAATQAAVRQSTVSASASEQTSTFIGSDQSQALVDDEDTDHSTLFDSLRTRGTRSTSGAQKRRIETIFDESPSPPRLASPKLKEILPAGMLGSPVFDAKDYRPTLDEDDNMATPVRTIRSDRADDGSPLAPRTKQRSPLPLNLSSPPDLNKALSLGTLEYDDEPLEEDDESRWSCFDEDSKISINDEWDLAEPNLLEGQVAMAGTHNTSAPSLSSPRFSPDGNGKDLRRDTRSSLFDYSELPSEKASGNGSPPRPRTVHGKKDTDRGSRSVGRRAPSGLHARSQSVPVAPGLAGKREIVVTNKFGTWGVGSKGVSEDWDEDFDFGDSLMSARDSPTGQPEEKRIDSGVVMHIPQTIREQQAKVVNNIGLVREFGTLIEELKAMSQRATARGLLEDPKSSLWQEIDAMIELADQEVHDPLLQRTSSPPSSPPNDLDFDEAREGEGRNWKRSTPDPRRSRSRRRSVLPSESDVFSTPFSQKSSPLTSRSSPPNPSTTPTRPRKDSEAMARSVIEALHRRKETPDTTLKLQPVPTHRKVPFDTNTLRYIVAHVHDLLKRAKAGDDLGGSNYTSASSVANEHLTDLFREPQTPPAPRNRRLELADDSHDQPDDISSRMKDMNIM